MYMQGPKLLGNRQLQGVSSPLDFHLCSQVSICLKFLKYLIHEINQNESFNACSWYSPIGSLILNYE